MGLGQPNAAVTEARGVFPAISGSVPHSGIIGPRRVTVKRSFLGVSKCISRNGFQTDHLSGSLQKFLTCGDPQVKTREVSGHSELFPMV